MKNKKLLIAILCIFVFDLPGAANRIRQNFDFDWQFRLGEFHATALLQIYSYMSGCMPIVLSLGAK